MSKARYIFIIAVFLYASCKHDPAEAPVQQLTGTTSTTSSTSGTTATVSDSVCFNTQILPLFLSNCAQGGCHDVASHQEGYTFTSYTGIMKGITTGKIMKEINKNGMPMAPVPPLSAEQKNLLNKWIAEGALNRTCSDPCDPAKPAFASGVSQIITTNCTGCHNGNVSNGGVNLQGYDNIRMQALSGKLVCSIEQGSGCSAMPQGAPKLSNNCITLIKNWITNGAQNN